MAHQFIHLELYARKPDKSGRSTSWVLDEAERKPDACPHVECPEPPQVVYGVDVGQIRRLHDEAAESCRVTLANGKSRAMRRDQKSLATVVASHPATMDQVRSDPVVAADVARWESLTVKWLQEQYGDRLVSVVRHTDESHAHLHAYVLPDGDMKASRMHPGYEAKRAVVDAGPREDEDAKSLNRRGDQAYRQAMRSWQDSYWERVGLPCGLTRLGPGRRRLTRAEWQAERSATAAVKIARERAARLDQRAREFVEDTKAKGAEYLDQARAEAAALTAAAQQQAEAAKALHDAAEAKEREARSMLSRARQEGARILAAARSEASRFQAWGGRLRTFLDGFRTSAMEEAARHAAAGEIERERQRAEEVSRKLLEEAQRRREAELKASDAAASARAIAIERDQARRQLATFKALVPERASNLSAR